MATIEVEPQRLNRSNSISQASENSQTAQEFINTQLQLEAEAREALPYQFDTCTRPLGPLRQSLFSCLTCNPPPKDSNTPYNAAGVCYSCSISCHGEHELVELFGKRNFVCDCGTTRLPTTSPCTLRINEESGSKGSVHSEKPAADNKYNQNFANRFCSCAGDYDPHTERGTMFQCLGLGTAETGGCGEDWYHPECIVGLSRDWKKSRGQDASKPQAPVGEEQTAQDVTKTTAQDHQGDGNADIEMTAELEDDFDDSPPGFPNEDDFEFLICYKCVDTNPWIKRYAGTHGFLRPTFHQSSDLAHTNVADGVVTSNAQAGAVLDTTAESKKRKASPDGEEELADQPLKKQRSGDDSTDTLPIASSAEEDKTEEVKPVCRYSTLPPAPEGSFSLFMADNFRDYLCRCHSCYPTLSKHPQLLEEEDSYEPPISADGDDAQGSLGSRSLLERGEAALSNVDRVRAIEGVMAYNHLKDKVKSFLKPFAESGQAVGAEDIKKYFEGLRGDADAIKAAGMKSSNGADGDKENDGRKEQSGY